MSWTETHAEVKAFRIQAKKEQPRSYLLFVTDVLELLAQNGGTLDGIRIYLGKKTVSGKVITTMHAVATIKDAAGNYNDYMMPVNNAALITAVGNGTVPKVKVPHPCPTYCSETNVLNS